MIAKAADRPVIRTPRRPALLVLVAVALLLGATAVPAAATVDRLDGPAPASWLSDPDGVDGNSGTEQGHPVVGSSGSATVNDGGATIRVRATGLEPGHAYTMWVVYFSDQRGCVDGCGGDDLSREAVGGGGVLFGDGKVVGGSGTATFATRFNTGEGADAIGPPPPSFAFGPYQASPHNEFHVVIRSHGPKIAGQVDDQIHTFGGGCVVEVGPAPAEQGDFPVPVEPGECGDVQLYIFS